MTGRLIAARAHLPTAKPAGVVRTGRSPKGTEAPPTPTRNTRIVGIDCGLARVSLAYFDLRPETVGKWYAADLVRKAGAYIGGWYVETPPDMALPDRLRAIGAELTRELRATSPNAYYVEMPAGAGIYARNQEDAQAFGGHRQEMTSKLYLGLGIILAVCAEQAARVGATLETPKPSKLGGKTKAERLHFVDVTLRRCGRMEVPKNPNDLDAVGVALTQPWSV